MTDLFDKLWQLHESTATRETYIRAPFGYPGSKTKSLDQILPHLPHRKKYIEPFGGSMVVLLNRPPSDIEVYNDRFGGCVSFYRCLKDPVKLESLAEKIQLSIHAREEFIFCKQTWQNVSDDVERAYRWYYVNQMSFTKKGTAFARATNTINNLGNILKGKLPGFWNIHERIRNVIIENQSWEMIIHDFDDPESVFYLDPPYIQYAQGIYSHEMSVEDHKRMLDTIFESKGFFALSGYPNSLYDTYPWDDCLKWQVRNTMVAQAFTESNNLAETEMKRTMETECLWVKE
jgi:DNA adenine methylase